MYKKFALSLIVIFSVVKVTGNVLGKVNHTDSLKSINTRAGKSKIVGGAKMDPGKDLVQNISQSKDHTTFATSITKAGLTETLKSRGPITVFAPVNDAFKKLPPGALDTLFKSSHSVDLTSFVSYYIVPGKLRSKDIAKQIAANHGETVITTLSGAKLKARINADRNIVLVDENGNESVISQFDIEQTNGILDVINGLLTTKSK